MSANNLNKDILFQTYNIVQSSMLSYPKQMIIETLRSYFKNSEYYHYSSDSYGFPNTTDHTDLPIGADLPTSNTQSTALSDVLIPTRLSISEMYRFDIISYPCLLVRMGSVRSVPISATRNAGTIQYSELLFSDGYNEKIVSIPSSFVTAGIFEGELTIEVITRSLQSRDELVELVAMCMIEINFDSLVDIGILVKPLTISAPTETDDRSDKLFRQTITLPIRTEWRRELPIGSLIETILFSVEFQNLSDPNSTPVEDLTINTSLNIIDIV